MCEDRNSSYNTIHSLHNCMAEEVNTHVENVKRLRLGVLRVVPGCVTLKVCLVGKDGGNGVDAEVL